MHALAFRHLPHEGLGLLRPALTAEGWDFEERDLERPQDVPDEAAGSEFDLLIVLGGPMSAAEAESNAILSREIAVVRRRLREGRPTLGICLGAQIMAASLGARVHAGSRPEVGWLPVTLTSEGERDPVFSALVRPSSMCLHWHQDTFELPEGAVPLAGSALYANQAFRTSDLGYAVQFHGEVPAGDLPEWIEKSHIPLNRPSETPGPSDILAGGERWGEACARQADAFMTAYLRAVARGVPGGMARRQTTSRQDER